MRDDRLRTVLLDLMNISVGEGTQSGRHISRLTERVVADMVAAGYDEDSIFTDQRHVTLPGWFRASKQWDIVAFEGDTLIAAIELKSIGKDFGNNLNNRVEEAIGSAIDLEHAVRNHLLEPNDLPPNFGYALVIHQTPGSLAKVRRTQARFDPDESFDGSSYIDRFVLMGKRLLRERIYQAVWVAVVDTELGVITEPDPQMTYDKFIARMKSWIDIARA